MLLVTCSAPWPHGPDPAAAACQQQPQCRVAELHQALHDGEDPVEVSCSLAHKKRLSRVEGSGKASGLLCCTATSVGARPVQQVSTKKRSIL